MQIWLGLVGAVIGAVAAVTGQLVAHRYAQQRELRTTARRLTAELLAQGRSVQAVIGRERQLDTVDEAGVNRTLVPFIRAWYELKWIAPPGIVLVAKRYVDEVDHLVKVRAKQQPGWLDEALVNAANTFEFAIGQWLDGPSGWRLSTLRLLAFSRRNIR